MTSPTSVNETTHERSTQKVDERAREFTIFALESLNLALTAHANEEFSLAISEDQRAAFSGAERVYFRFAPSGESDTSTEDSTFLNWLVARLRDNDQILHATPRDGADGVTALTPSLYGCYEVFDGRVQLGGCTLSDRPFFQWTHKQDEQLAHSILDEEGSEVDSSMVANLKLQSLKPAERLTQKPTSKQLQSWKKAAPKQEVVAGTIIWCKHADGKLVFKIGGKSAELNFSDWAQFLADGISKPPPFRCPETGKESYTVVATDDGDITVPEAIVTCEESGRRVLPDALETCEATGRQALAKFFADCSVTGTRILESALVECGMCRERVNPTSIEGGRCLACRSTKKINKDEPRLVRVLAELPGLERWRNWQISETATNYILLATGMLKRLVVVVDKETLELRNLAAGSRFSKNWSEVPDNIRDDTIK